MNSLLSASVSMRALQHKLDTHSNNIANWNTAGYKKRDATFQEVLTTVKAQPEPFRHASREQSLGLVQSFGIQIHQTPLHLTQGTLTETGGQFDFAIEGNGLFEVLTGDGTAAWTRNGSFTIEHTEGNQGVLTTAQGYRVLGVNDEPIILPLDQEIHVDEFGRLWGSERAVSDESDEVEGPIAQLKVRRVLHPHALQNVGDQLFTVVTGIQPEAVFQGLEEPITDEASDIAVRQGFIEQSNVNLIDEMTEIMMTQRAFQLNSRAISTGDTMMGMANNLRA